MNLCSFTDGENAQLIFCHRGYQTTDYALLKDLFKVFRMGVSFLDYEHYSTPADGDFIVNGDFIVLSIDEAWMGFHGKSTVICCNDKLITRRCTISVCSLLASNKPVTILTLRIIADLISRCS